MRLSSLTTTEGGDPEILGLTADSRAVRPGFVFAALPGVRADGRTFIPQALARGAVAVLAPEGTRLPADASQGVVLLTDPAPRHRFALMAARFHPAQPAAVVAVTGTNGKTSTVQFAQQLWQGLGLKAAALGTLGVTAPGIDLPKTESMTTPDPVALHAGLDTLARAGVVRLAMEASSHGLDQGRLDGVSLVAAAFTNLTRDHLDYHGGMDAYFQAKIRLFGALLRAGGAAILNADSPEFPTLAALCHSRGQRVVGYGTGADRVSGLALLKAEPLPHGQRLHLCLFGHERVVELPLIGTFQAANVLAAVGLVLAAEQAAGAVASLDDAGLVEALISGVSRLEGVPGRMQSVARAACGAAVIVDYAHTPDALETALKAARPHVTGRLRVVFGCGGDRDPGKRPMMGAIAARLADHVIVTDDNPRSEVPSLIRAAILAASPGAEEIGDRAAAIGVAVGALQAGDVLVIAGKGHEQGQIIGSEVRPFDDADVARNAVAQAGGR